MRLDGRFLPGLPLHRPASPSSWGLCSLSRSGRRPFSLPLVLSATRSPARPSFWCEPGLGPGLGSQRTHQGGGREALPGTRTAVGVAFQVEGRPVQELSPKRAGRTQSAARGLAGLPWPAPTPREGTLTTARGLQRPLTLCRGRAPPCVPAPEGLLQTANTCLCFAATRRSRPPPGRAVSQGVWLRVERGLTPTLRGRCALRVLREQRHSPQSWGAGRGRPLRVTQSIYTWPVSRVPHTLCGRRPQPASLPGAVGKGAWRAWAGQGPGPACSSSPSRLRGSGE